MTREEFISMMGFSDNSPLRNEDSLNIQTGPNGIIDMSNTGMPLMANGRYLPPYSGHHQFDPNSIVTEIPVGRQGGQLPKAQDGEEFTEVAGLQIPKWMIDDAKDGRGKALQNFIYNSEWGTDAETLERDRARLLEYYNSDKLRERLTNAGYEDVDATIAARISAINETIAQTARVPERFGSVTQEHVDNRHTSYPNYMKGSDLIGIPYGMHSTNLPGSDGYDPSKPSTLAYQYSPDWTMDGKYMGYTSAGDANTLFTEAMGNSYPNQPNASNYVNENQIRGKFQPGVLGHEFGHGIGGYLSGDARGRDDEKRGWGNQGVNRAMNYHDAHLLNTYNKKWQAAPWAWQEGDGDYDDYIYPSTSIPGVMNQQYPWQLTMGDNGRQFSNMSSYSMPDEEGGIPGVKRGPVHDIAETESFSDLTGLRLWAWEHLGITPMEDMTPENYQLIKKTYQEQNPDDAMNRWFDKYEDGNGAELFDLIGSVDTEMNMAKYGKELPKFQDVGETELNQHIKDLNIETKDVDATGQRDFQKKKVGSEEWLNRVIREQEDRGNAVTKEQAIQFQNQALFDLDQGIVKSQTWDDFFSNPLNNQGQFDYGTQGFNITQPSSWDPITQTFRADPSGQMSNTMLISENDYFKGNQVDPWTFAHETGHNWNWRNPFNNDPSRQFIGNTYLGKDNMFNKFNPDYTSDDFDHDRGGVGTTNVGEFGQYQQAAPELRSEKAALEKELFDLGLYDPTQPFTEQHLRDILDSGNMSSEARELLDGLGYKDLLKERHDVIQATKNSTNSGNQFHLPTDLRDKKTAIERMYAELGSRYATNANLGPDNWKDMYESERERHNEEFGTTPREVSDGWGGTETREMSDLEYESYLRNQKWRADQELYGNDAVYGETSLTGGVQSPGYFSYDMENISDANETLTGYMDNFLNANPDTPMLHEVKDIEGMIIGYSESQTFGQEPTDMIPWSKESQAIYDNQGTGGPTEAQWNTYVDGLFTEEESYNTDNPESNWGMKIDESKDYTWPAEEGDDDYDPDNIQENNSLYDLCYDEDGNPSGNPDCTESHIKRLEDNQTRHSNHRKIDQLSYNANSIRDLFGTSTSIHVENARSLFDMSGGVAKTGPNSPIIEGHYSEMFPEGTPEYDARQRLISTMNRLHEKNPGKSADLDRESLTPEFIQDMKLVQDALMRTRKSLQEKRQGLVDEYYQGVDKYRSTDYKQLIIEQQEELDNELKDNNITNFMNRVYSQNDQEISDNLPPVTNARYGKELPRFQKKGEYDWEIATEKSIYPDGEYNWYNPADSYRYLTNENETTPIPPPPPEDPESAKNKSEIPLSWDEYKIEKPSGTIEQFRRYIRNPKYKDWRMNIFSPYTNRTKKGWANKEYYRGLDEEGVGEVQEWLIEQGYDIKKDNGWGDQTYNALNNYLLDNKLLNKEITTDPLLTDDLLINQQYIESDGKPKAGSNKGAQGLVQAMEGAWKDAIKKGILPENADRTNINHSLVFQRYYMNSLMNAEFVTDATSDNEKLARALSAYNWGRGNTPTFFKNINYVATNETIKDKEGNVIESGFRNKLDKDGNPILVPEDERRDPLDMDSWMTILNTDKESTRWTIPKETVDYINLIMFPDKYIEMYSKKQYESRIKSTKKFEDYKKKAKKFYSYKEGGSVNKTKQLIRTYKLGGELSGLTIKHLEEIGVIPQYKEGGTTHTINDEEALLGIAKEYNTTEKDINKYNNLIDTESLYKGQVLNIPEPIAKTPLEIKKEKHKLGDYGTFKNMTLDTQIKLYSNYVNGDYMMFSEKLGKKLYDKLNRVYYDKARVLNMSVLDYMKSILS